MPIRFAFAVLLMTGIALPGCSLPRGPIILDPLVPRWLATGEVSGDCAPDPLPVDGVFVDPAAIQPPVSKFHPVPTRPVFEPTSAAAARELQL